MNYKCSFCGLEFDERHIVQGAFGNICINCLEQSSEEIYINNLNSNIDNRLLKPHELKNELDKYIIGQENAKKKLCVEVYNHYKRINFKSNSIELPKANILILGPTGSGKTFLVETLSKILNVPLVIGDATTLTEVGYVGKDVDSLLQSLIEKAHENLELAQKGIIYIDEIDKIASNKTSSNEKDVGGEGVQQSLLKIIEGTEYTFEKTGQTINTKNILFICGGCFDGITKQIDKRINKKSSIGFNVSSSNNKKYSKDELLSNVKTEDLLEFGMIKEFVGRLHLLVTLNELTEEDLKNILLKPKNALVKQYKTLLKLDGITLNFDKDAIDYIVKEAKLKGTGARALKGIMSDKLNDLMYELPIDVEKNKKYKVTKKYLESK